MKNKLFGFMIVLMMFLGTSSDVYAQEDYSVQSILDEIEQLADTKDEVNEEVKELTVSELEKIDEYLINKQDITISEETILESVQSILYGENTLESTINRNIKYGEELKDSEKEIQDLMRNLSEEELNSLVNSFNKSESLSSRDKVVLQEAKLALESFDARISLTIFGSVLILSLIAITASFLARLGKFNYSWINNLGELGVFLLIFSFIMTALITLLYSEAVSTYLL